MKHYESNFRISHKRPICITPEALLELSQIMGYARAELMPPPPADLEVNDEDEELAAHARRYNNDQIERYEHEFATVYSVEFSNGFRPTKKSIENLLDTLNSEPDAPTEIKFGLGASYSRYFEVEIGGMYGTSVNIRVSGPDAIAETTVRKLRNWLKIHEPDYAWARSNFAHFTMSALIAIISTSLLLYSNWNILSIILQNYVQASPILVIVNVVFLFGFFFAAYTLIEKLFPIIEFQLGWARRKSKVRKSLIALLISLFAIPILLHIVGLT